MKKRRVLWAIVFGTMLAVTGCGDDGGGDSGGGDGGSSGTGGSTGTGGGNGSGPSSSTCEAICSSTCVFEGVDPGEGDFDQCASQCSAILPQYNDDCGPQMDAFLECLEANGCDDSTRNCDSQILAWGSCVGVPF
jgi:hypothetical protein